MKRTMGGGADLAAEMYQKSFSCRPGGATFDEKRPPLDKGDSTGVLGP